MSNTGRSFINEIFACLNKSDATGLAKVLSLKNVQYKSLYLSDDDKHMLTDRFRSAPNDIFNWSEVINYYALFRNSLGDEDYATAYDLFSKSFKSLNDLIKDAKEENWQLPVLFRMSVDLRLFAYMCDVKKQKNLLNAASSTSRIDDADGGAEYKPNEFAEKTAESLMASFRILSGDNRVDFQVRPNHLNFLFNSSKKN